MFARAQLIRALYQPNPPETISRIQEVLHRLQRSPEGWQLAQSLIAHREDNIRFYAALTLIVKLNRDRYVRVVCALLPDIWLARSAPTD